MLRVSHLTGFGVFTPVVAAAGLTLVGTASDTIDGNGANADITLPGGLQEDDIVIVGVSSDGDMSSRGIQTSGYTDIIAAGSDNPGRHLAYKLMGASPDSVVNVTSGAFRHAAITIHAWRGANTTTPVETANTATGNGASPDPASHTTANNNAVRIIWAGGDDDEGTGMGAPSGFENLAAIATSAGSNVGTTNWMASKLEATAGALDPGAFTVTNFSDEWVTAHFSINPA